MSLRLPIALLTLAVVAFLASSRIAFQLVPTSFAASPIDSDIQAMVNYVDPSSIDATIRTLVGFGTRNACSDNSGNGPGIGAARDWIRNQFAAIPGVQVTLVPFVQSGCPGSPTRHDVVAWIQGATHPNRLIVLGGHYDSRTSNVSDGVSPAPGANDSGSQTALVLEVARAMATYRNDATIVFAAWAGEEQGLVGSKAFVKNYQTFFPNSTIELNLNFDIVGGDNTANDQAALQQFRLYSPGTPREISSADGTTDDTSPSRGVMRHIGYWGAQYVPGMTMIPKLREDRVNRGSDHQSFIASAIPGVRFIEVNENVAHQHSPNDIYDYVTPAYTARVAQVAAATAAGLARASTPPRSFTAQAQGTGGNVKLTWAAPASGPAVGHYVVSARRTSENFYRVRYSIAAAAKTATLSAVSALGIPSGSAYYISIAAVDAAGHESLFAYPEYRCTTSSCSVPSGATNVTQTR